MRKLIAAVAGLALVVVGVAFVGGTRTATAQGGGTIEAEVKYNGAPQVEKLKIIKLTCDVHSWMLGWVAVMPNPYFGVTDGSGVTKVENVPPGKYKVEAWHETLGKQTKDVEVKAGQTTKVAFEMKK